MAEINLLHVHHEAIGYGRYGVNLARELVKMGVDVFDHLPEPGELPPQRDLEHLAHLNTGSASKVCNVVAWISVPTHARGWHNGQYPVVSSMWESQSLPESFRESLHNFPLVVVPSHQNQELFSRYHDNVKFVPLGVDPAVWHQEKRPEVGAQFRFLIGGSGPRKGTDLAYKAFRAAFPKVPEGGAVPTLVMKSPRAEGFGGPAVEIVGGRISDEAEVDLYASAHCYLQPSRGEGFGLQPLQALAQGCPTILTAAHGHDAFAHLGLGIPATPKAAAYFIYGDAGDWWEPDFDALVDQMRWVYWNYATACDQAARAAQVIAAEFTWANTARRFVDAIGPERLEVPASVDGWYTPDVKLYEVVTNRPWKCEVAGITYFFEQGKSYRELADIKRIAFESGILDPVCVTGDDTGLSPGQLEGVAEYSARHSYCPTCGTQLNSGITRADAIERELNAAASASA
jgi:glycosyltransferase involved in cell wall biosynthesis